MINLDFFAKICGYTYAYMTLVYYRIRYPFSWGAKFDAAYKTRYKEEEFTYIGARKQGGKLWIGGDYTIKDVTNIHEVIWSFTLGNSIIPNSRGEYISVKPQRS